MLYKVWYHKFWERSEGTNQEWVKVRELEAVGLEDVFYQQQGEIWSPHGEAREIIISLGLKHTSMMVGDFIETPDGKFYRVENMGFEVYDKLPTDEKVDY